MRDSLDIPARLQLVSPTRLQKSSDIPGQIVVASNMQSLILENL
jgi:hypothetical protein